MKYALYPRMEENAMIWMHYVWEGLLAKMTLHCWIIAISLSPQHNEILLLLSITQFIWKAHTVCILYLEHCLCVHSKQMLANEPKHRLACVSFARAPLDESRRGPAAEDLVSAVPRKNYRKRALFWLKEADLFLWCSAVLSRRRDSLYCSGCCHTCFHLRKLPLAWKQRENNTA